MVNKEDVARAQRYREYMSNNAYIPLQDIPLYQKSFEKIYYVKGYFHWYRTKHLKTILLAWVIYSGFFVW